VVCFFLDLPVATAAPALAVGRETASQLTNQLEYAASRAVPDLTSTRVDTNNPKALRAAITNYLHADTNLNDMLESVVGNSRIVYDAAIIDPNGVAILDTNPALNGKPVPERPRLSMLRGRRLPPPVAHALRPGHRLRRQHRAGTRQAGVGSVHVGVSTVSCATN